MANNKPLPPNTAEPPDSPDLMAQLASFLQKAAAKEKQKRKAAAKAATGPAADAATVADLEAARAWVAALGIKYEPRGHTFRYLGRSRPPSFLGRVFARNVAGRAPAVAELAMQLYADTCRDAVVAQLRRELPLEGRSNDATAQFLRFFLQREPGPLDLLMFNQFIWQIKRRVHGLPTEWEIMPLFTGGQGWGKTRHLQRLWAAIPTLPTFVARGQRFAIFNDDFGRAIFNQCFLIPFEEMSGARATDIETLKMFITESEVQARIMRAEQFHVMRLNATFYGTSNMPGGASLSDSTGMRRFWEFECPSITFSERDHGAALEALDLRGIWTGVDATTDASPARGHIAEINAAQNKQFAKSGALHDFFMDRVQECANPATYVSRRSFWDAFIEWRQGQMYADKLTMQHMNDYVRRTFGPDRVKQHATGTVFYGLELKP